MPATSLTISLFFEQWAFWATTGGIVVGAVAGFFLVYSYLKARKIL
jgi:hypothetical protein